MSDNLLKARTIRSVFSAIKRDNVLQLEAILSNNPEMLLMKNNQRENLLFYAFEKESIKCIDFLIQKKPEFLKEKNILNLNIIHKLIQKQIDPEIFLNKAKSLKIQEIEEIYRNCDMQGNNLLIIASKQGDVNVLKKVIDFCPIFKELEGASNFYGQTIAHFVALNVEDDCVDVIKKFSPQTMRKMDNLSGVSPLMIAAYQQSENNFKEFYNLLPQDQVSLIGNSLSHFAANNNGKIISHLINCQIFKNNKSKIEQTPLNIALSKNNDSVVEIIVNEIESRNEGFNADDVIALTKISSRHINLFEKAINNPNNEKLNSIQQKKFLESLFVYASYACVEKTLKTDSFASCMEFKDFSLLFPKILINKKDMLLKTNFLLEGKDKLSLEEVIIAVNSLEKLPSSQIKYILEKTKLLDSCNKEDMGLFKALCLSRGVESIPFKNDNLTIENEEAQITIKNLLKNNKIENSKKVLSHIANITEWLSLVKDKKVVWKNYGNLASKYDEPFQFIQDNFNFLQRENIKDLVFFTVTALIKKPDPISKQTMTIIKGFPNLVANVFAGAIKFGKIPENQQLLEFLPKIKQQTLKTNELISFLKRTKKNQKQAIDLLSSTIQLFDLNKIDNMSVFCDALISNNYHQKIIPLITSVLVSKKDEFISEYSLSYIRNTKVEVTDSSLFNLMMEHSNPQQLINNFINEAIAQDGFVNIDILKKLNKIVKNQNLAKVEYTQNLIDEQMYDACFKLQKLLDKKFKFKEIDFSNTDWEKIDIALLNREEKNNFFDFIAINQSNLTEAQINQLTDSIVSSILKNNLSFDLIEKFLTSIDSKLDKIEDDKLFQISSYVLKKQAISDIMINFLSPKSFDNIFAMIANSGNIDVLSQIKKDENYDLIEKETQIAMNKQILDNQLPIKESFKPPPRRIKI